ncbi:MAG: fluoride efflux transporter CrcB [Nitrospirae bacterium]|nr:fluoride efflux transporter CrcB [Nitrospirota bacterium]
MADYLIIGIGGFIGSIARYVLTVWIRDKWGMGLPIGTFVVNISGSFLIGLVTTVLMMRHIIDPQWRLFIVVGFLGAYTTFSTFEIETSTLLKQGETLAAALYVVFSVIIGYIALKLGDAAGRVI